MEMQSLVQQLLSCLARSENSLRLPDEMQFSLIYDAYNAAFILDNTAATSFRQLLSLSYKQGIVIEACYVRFTACFGQITSERQIDLYLHLPLPLRWLLHLCYHMDGIYITFRGT